MTPRVNVVIIGAGIVGLATALELVTRSPRTSLVVVEKESEVASHQSGHNSGVIHSGIYYKPGTLKARLCIEGAAALTRFCQETGVPYELCGKIIAATSERECIRIDELHRRGVENGLQGLQMLSADEIREFEPHAAGLRGIRIRQTGIVDFRRVAEKYADIIAERGGSILLSRKVLGIRRSHDLSIVETTKGEIQADFVVNCAGLQSDRVGRMAGVRLDLAIVPFRGEYYQIAPEKEHYVKGLLYPVPDPQLPFLGVHFTRRIGGGIEAGPNAVLALKREGYSKTSFAVRDIFGYATFPGFWLMAAKYWKTSLDEYHRSWSKAAFLRSLQRLIPELQASDLVEGGSGVRAQAIGRDGRLIDDFHFASADGILHVCNVPSPAATASLAIGRHIVDTIAQRRGNALPGLS